MQQGTRNKKIVSRKVPHQREHTSSSTFARMLDRSGLENTFLALLDVDDSGPLTESVDAENASPLSPRVKSLLSTVIANLSFPSAGSILLLGAWGGGGGGGGAFASGTPSSSSSSSSSTISPFLFASLYFISSITSLNSCFFLVFFFFCGTFFLLCVLLLLL